MLLAIDTSTRYAGVALWREGLLLYEVAWRSERNHTVELAPAVDLALKRVGATPADLQGVAVALGPGSFSALRAGLGLAKGLAEALDIPLVGVGTLEVEAWPWRGLGAPVCPLLPMGRGEVAWALFQGQGEGWGQTHPEALAPLEAVLEGLPRPVVVCGEGAGLVGGRAGQGVYLAEVPPPTRRPGVLALLGARRLERGGGDDRATLQPLYLRRPSITLRGGA